MCNCNTAEQPLINLRVHRLATVATVQLDVATAAKRLILRGVFQASPPSGDSGYGAIGRSHRCQAVDIKGRIPARPPSGDSGYRAIGRSHRCQAVDIKGRIPSESTVWRQWLRCNWT